LGVSSGEQAVPPEVRQRIIRAACRWLFEQGAVEEALFLNERAASDAQAANFQLRLVRMLEDRRRLAAAMRRLAGSLPRSWATQVSLLELRLRLARGRQADRNPLLHRSLAIRPVHHRIFGPLHATVRDQLDGLRVERFANPGLENLIGSLIELRQIAPAARDHFRHRLLWGRTAKLFLEYLARVNSEFLRWPKEHQGAESRVVERLRLLARELDQYLVVTGFSAMDLAAREGRSLLAAQAHAGINRFWNELLDSLALKSIVFAAHPGTKGNESVHRVSTSSDGAQLGFLKAAKKVRKGQWLIRIFPDGGDGGDGIEGSVLGVPVSIGAGAGRLAWHAGAATFFLGSRWRDDGRLELFVVPGPVAGRGIDKDEFEKDFADFHFARLNEIASGAPEDMGGIGGLWTRFARTESAITGRVA
jgi:hypothetical protein